MPSFYEILIQARDEASPVFSRVSQNAKRAAVDVDRASSSQGGLRGLKAAFGEESGFGLGVKTLAGAGALAGVGLAANLFADFGDSVKNLTKEYQAGTKSAKDVSIALIEGLPIIGGFVRGASSLTEAFIETTEGMKSFRALQREAEFIEQDRQDRRDRAGRGTLFQDALGAFDRGANAPTDAEGRRRAQFDAENRELDRLQKLADAADPTGVNNNRILERRLDAQKRLDADLAELRRKAMSDELLAAERGIVEQVEAERQAREKAEKDDAARASAREELATMRKEDRLALRAKGLRAELAGIALKESRADAARGDPIFGLQESRRLTGVQGAKSSADELVAEARKQREAIEKQLARIEQQQEDIADIARAARENKLLIATLGGKSNAA